MKAGRYLLIGALLCCTAAMLPGCATSVLVDQWADPSYGGPTLGNILVVAARKDPVRRRMWEDAFVPEFARHGVGAVQSYRYYPSDLPDSSQIAQAVQSYDFDGILISRWLPEEKTPVAVSGYVEQVPQTGYNPRRNHFYTYYQAVEHPGYIDTQTTVRHAFDVWTTGPNGRMIWSAVSMTAEPSSPQAAHAEIVKMITSALTKNGVIPPKR